MIEENQMDDELMAFERELDAIIPHTNKHKEAANFAKVYVSIEKKLSTGAPKKDVLEKFKKAFGLKTHSSRFRELLENERRRRKDGGNPAMCEHCQRPFHAGDDVSKEGPGKGDGTHHADSGVAV